MHALCTASTLNLFLSIAQHPCHTHEHMYHVLACAIRLKITKHKRLPLTCVGCVLLSPCQTCQVEGEPTLAVRKEKLEETARIAKALRLKEETKKLNEDIFLEKQKHEYREKVSVMRLSYFAVCMR
jgi:hypothetical protein